MRNSLAVDYTINGYKLTLEGIYTKVIRDLKFQQVNLKDNVSYYTYDTAHQMPIYTNTAINSNFSNAYLLSNTDQGYRYSITAQISKTYPFGFNFMTAYTYGESKDITNGIRNSMESNWQLNQSLTPNDPKLANSNFDIRHRIVSNLGYQIALTKKNTLSTNLYFNAQSGNPFTWGFVNATIANDPQAAGLAYIFKDVAEASRYIGTVTGSGSSQVCTTNAQQVHDFENFINNNEDWGRSYFVSNTFNSTASVGLTKIGNYATGPYLGDPIYKFSTPTNTPYSMDQFAARFQGQFGLRYSF